MEPLSLSRDKRLNRHTVKEYLPTIRFQQSKRQLRDSGLSATVCPHQSEHPARPDRKADVFQHLTTSRIREIHTPKLQLRRAVSRD